MQQLANINQNFKAPVVSFKAGNTNYYNPQAGVPNKEAYDRLELAKQQDKANSREKWQKAGILAQIGLAVAFGTMAIMEIVKHKWNTKHMDELLGKGGKAAQELKKSIEEIKDEGIRKVAMSEFEKGEHMRSDKKIKDLIALSKIGDKKPEMVDLNKAIKIMDEKLIDMNDVKEQILDFLIHWNTNIANGVKNDKPLVLCLNGAPGTGKTTATEVIAEAIGAPYKKIALGGASGSSIIRGTESKFVGAEAGGVARGMIDNESKRVVYCLDEAEKVAKDSQHGDPHAAMASLTDGTGKFDDDFLGVTLDTTQSIFVLTTNEVEQLPSYLRSRVKLMEIAPFTAETKSKIADLHIKYALGKSKLANKVKVTDGVGRAIADLTTDNGGRDTTKLVYDQLIPTIEKLNTIGQRDTKSIKFVYPDKSVREVAKLDDKGKIIVDEDFINLWLKEGAEKPFLRDQVIKAA